MEVVAKSRNSTIVMEEEKEEEGGRHLGFGSVAPPLSCCLEQAPAAQEVPTSPPIMIILWKILMI